MTDQGTLPDRGGDTGSERYGGFWIRVLAYIVDGIILNIVFWLLVTIFGIDMFGGMLDSDPAAMAAASGAMGWVNLAGFVIALAYSAGFHSSSLQATPGKLLVKLKVTDSGGQRISMLRAIGREFARYLSGIILLIGFIMVAFTDRKRGLHDMMAGTLVTYRS